MPSFLNKIRSSTAGTKLNPYARRDHPSNPIYNPSLNSPVFDPFSPPPPSNATVSPRGSIDYLAEARQASGRDPVTGKKSTSSAAPRAHGPGNPSKAPKKSSSFLNLRRKHRDEGAQAPTDPSTDPRNPFADPIPAAAASASAAGAGAQQTAGGGSNSRYEQYVRQTKERELARQALREPEGGSFYAPRRRTEEFYGAGVGGGGGRVVNREPVVLVFRDGRLA